MRNLVLFIVTSVLLAGCSESNDLNGVWYHSFSVINDREPEVGMFRTSRLLEFREDYFVDVKIGNRLSDDQLSIFSDTFELEIHGDSFLRGADTVDFRQYGDSLVLTDGIVKLVFRRLEDELRNDDVTCQDFLGPKRIMGYTYCDSLDFLNDSILIYTGDYRQLSPALKWTILEYSNFKFLNINDELSPILLITSIDSSDITLTHPGINVRDYSLKSSDTIRRKSEFLGTWIGLDTEDDSPPPKSPVLPTLKDYYEEKIIIDDDSITIYNPFWIEQLQWAPSNDGSVIYFPSEDIRDIELWKIQRLTDSTLTILFPDMHRNTVKKFRRADTIRR